MQTKYMVRSFRVDAVRAARLAALARATKRSQSDVLRLLIDAASVGADEPALVLDGATQSWLTEQLESILGDTSALVGAV